MTTQARIPDPATSERLLANLRKTSTAWRK